MNTTNEIAARSIGFRIRFDHSDETWCFTRSGRRLDTLRQVRKLIADELPGRHDFVVERGWNWNERFVTWEKVMPWERDAR